MNPLQPGIMSSKRLAQIVAEEERELFVDTKTHEVLSSFGFQVDNLMDLDKDSLFLA